MSYLFNYIRTWFMKDPAEGILRVVGRSFADTDGATFSSCEIIGVLIVSGLEAIPFQRTLLVRTSKWPEIGMELPVMVDRQDPTRVKILWSKVESTEHRAIEEARKVADDINKSL